MKKLISGFIIILSVFACSHDPAGEKIIAVNMEQGLPVEGRNMRWSPKGEKLMLEEKDSGFIARLFLGTEGLDPVNLLLYSSVEGDPPDRLAVDMNRNGLFNEDADTIWTCIPSESRGKTWSSFTGIITLPFEKSKGHKAVVNDYPVSLWYVFDPVEPDAEKVIRYSRRGWMKGRIETEEGAINILLTDRKMDGIFDRNDSWALAPDSSVNDLFNSKSARGTDTHAWLGEQAFGIDSLIPSGRIVWLKKVDPQITRAEEEAANDWLAPDRAAKRGGDKVPFIHDFDYASGLAKERKQNLLVDFETTWCGPCKTMDQWVYTADTVINAARNIVCVKVDGDENRGLVKKFDVAGYPTMILMSPEGKILKKVTGYQSVAGMVEFLK